MEREERRSHVRHVLTAVNKTHMIDGREVFQRRSSDETEEECKQGGRSTTAADIEHTQRLTGGRQCRDHIVEDTRANTVATGHIEGRTLLLVKSVFQIGGAGEFVIHQWFHGRRRDDGLVAPIEEPLLCASRATQA